MKIFYVFLLFALSSTKPLNAQSSSSFVDYLLQLQYATDPLYYYMLEHFNDARRDLSRLLTGLNDDSVMEITDGLRAVIAIRDRVDNLAQEVTNEICVNDSLSSWPQDLENVGNEISQCANTNLDQLLDDIARIHNFLLENNNLKFETQNMVLSVFTELNPMTEAEMISSNVERRIDDIERQFNTDTRSGIETILADIERLRTVIPESIHTCVNDAIIGFNSTAFDIITALNAC